MRGCPGSGKSFLAKKNCLWFQGIILGADQYFEDEEGNYNFDLSKLNEAHEWNLKRVEGSMKIPIPQIYVDNTNTRLWEMKKYVELAQKYGYEVSFMVANSPWAWDIDELFNRNTHNVPRETIERMVNRFEHQGDLTDEEFVEKILESEK